MTRKLLTYSFGAIALYLVLVHATGAGTLLTDTAKAGEGSVEAFQGR